MIDVNLLPEHVQQASALRTRVGRWAIIVGVAAAALVVSGVIDWYHHAEAAGLQAEYAQVQAQVETLRADLRGLTATVKEKRLQLERGTALRSKRAWSALIAMAGRAIPDGCWLTSLATDPPQPSGGTTPARRVVTTAGHPSPTVGSKGGGKSARDTVDKPLLIDGPSRLRLTGYCRSEAAPPRFVETLGQPGVFRSVTLEGVRSEPVFDGQYYRFELVCEW